MSIIFAPWGLLIFFSTTPIHLLGAKSVSVIAPVSLAFRVPRIVLGVIPTGSIVIHHRVKVVLTIFAQLFRVDGGGRRGGGGAATTGESPRRRHGGGEGRPGPGQAEGGATWGEGQPRWDLPGIKGLYQEETEEEGEEEGSYASYWLQWHDDAMCETGGSLAPLRLQATSLRPADTMSV